MDLLKPTQRLDHPLARAPYAMPNASTPARLRARTPQSTKVTNEVKKLVVAASVQGFILSER